MEEIKSPGPFAGFAQPTSNTTYAPNQFFDVCMKHCSRGTVRVVAFMIRKTLGWCDANGDPQAEQHAVSYQEFENAGISRAMIRQSLEEAIEGHFIRCVSQPQSKALGQTAITGSYELQWDERDQYIKDPRQFRGFFAGEGNRTYIPNQYFDQIVVNEKLAVIKVVGAVIRLSIGFANKLGHRRRNVELSLTHIRNYSRISDTKNVSDAIREALAANYIQQVEAGYFDRDGGKASRAAKYALKWAETAQVAAVESPVGMKLPTVETEPKDRFEIASDNGLKLPAADRYEIASDIEIKQRNKTLKQQEAAAATFERLRKEGFDERTARIVIRRYPVERIERQIAWIGLRKVKTNRVGMIRTAIEQDWEAPATGAGRPGIAKAFELGAPNLVRPAGASFGEAMESLRRKFI